jgi:hypothetical protein
MANRVRGEAERGAVTREITPSNTCVSLQQHNRPRDLPVSVSSSDTDTAVSSKGAAVKPPHQAAIGADDRNPRGCCFQEALDAGDPN